jgi:hypothetical protein
VILRKVDDPEIENLRSTISIELDHDSKSMIYLVMHASGGWHRKVVSYEESQAKLRSFSGLPAG